MFSSSSLISLLFIGSAPHLILSSPLEARALGINCRGSSDCTQGTSNQLGPLMDIIDKMDDNKCVGDGKQIGCVDGGITTFCAFTQGLGHDYCGKDIKASLQYLKDHGCDTCGSVPIAFPASNDPKGGIFTVNAVSHSGCHDASQNELATTGLCPDAGGPPFDAADQPLS